MNKNALLVIDIQRGAFDAKRCPPIDSPERLVGNARRLIDAARAGGRPIVFIQHCENVPGEPFEEGTEHWELHEALVPARGDTVLRKYASSSFEGTDLDGRLKDKGIEALTLCGLQSEFCVTNTARSALGLGYAVSVADDGHGTWPSNGRSADEIREEVNAKLAAAGAQVSSTDALSAALRGAAA
jgi:nicotinamidase-related amidase